MDRSNLLSLPGFRWLGRHSSRMSAAALLCLLMSWIGVCGLRTAFAASDKEDQAFAEKCIADETLVASDIPRFDAYFERVEFKNLFAPNSEITIATARVQFAKRWFPSGKGGAPREHLLALTTAAINKTLASERSMTVKTNALLLAADLAEESNAQGTRLASAGLDILINAAAQEQAPPAIRFTALKGIYKFTYSRNNFVSFEQRTIKAVVTDEQRGKIAKIVQKLLESWPKTSEHSISQPLLVPDSQQLLVRYAAQIIALQGDSGPQNNLLQGVAALLKDKNLRIEHRTWIALHLGEFNFTANSKPSPGDLAKDVLDLARLSCQMEFEHAIELATPQAGRVMPSKRRVEGRLEPLMWSLFGTKTPLRFAGLLEPAKKLGNNADVAEVGDELKKWYKKASDEQWLDLLKIVGTRQAAAEVTPETAIDPSAAAPEFSNSADDSSAPEVPVAPTTPENP